MRRNGVPSSLNRQSKPPERRSRSKLAGVESSGHQTVGTKPLEAADVPEDDEPSGPNRGTKPMIQNVEADLWVRVPVASKPPQQTAGENEK
ncbi:unnamed protein product [Cochlearia groenlandica]